MRSHLVEVNGKAKKNAVELQSGSKSRVSLARVEEIPEFQSGQVGFKHTFYFYSVMKRNYM